MDFLELIFPKQQMKTSLHSYLLRDECALQDLFTSMSESNIASVIDEAMKASVYDSQPTLQDFLRMLEDDNCATSECGEVAGFATKKRKDKRNRRKPLETKTLLAQCLLQWLEDSRYNPSAITWLSKRDGLFQITNSATISTLWGSRKGNKKVMNHEKLSRALRHYYKDGTLERMENKKKLCYKFTSQAMQKFSAFFSNC
ncbi:ETS homologous factor-like isoform X2 [Rhopilema esculentum]|uniref:ETS homologous factor-like isoform X2 n=1 Tax=Rhopilema esculentum TaxID=499914 RepID=UPI0031D8CC93